VPLRPDRSLSVQVTGVLKMRIIVSSLLLALSRPIQRVGFLHIRRLELSLTVWVEMLPPHIFTRLRRNVGMTSERAIRSLLH
jgi:hypothetical protein